VLVLLGIVRSFNGPVSRSLLPQLVPEQHFPNAVAWNSSIFQTATILGPALGGLVYAFFRRASPVYATALLVSVAAVISTLRIELRTESRPREEVNWTTVLAGFRYIWQQKIILGSISLDMFAVLLGGATVLLPAFADKILFVGPIGFGWLRAAPRSAAGDARVPGAGGAHLSRALCQFEREFAPRPPAPPRRPGRHGGGSFDAGQPGPRRVPRAARRRPSPRSRTRRSTDRNGSPALSSGRPAPTRSPMRPRPASLQGPRQLPAA